MKTKTSARASWEKVGEVGVDSGQLVYPAFTPQKAGKIVAIEPSGIVRQATIRMANGKTYQTDARNLRELGALYEDHRRKAERLADLIEKLKED